MGAIKRKIASPSQAENRWCSRGFMACRITEVYTCVAYMFLSAMCCALVSYGGLKSKVYYLCDSRANGFVSWLKERVYIPRVARFILRTSINVPRLEFLLSFVTQSTRCIRSVFVSQRACSVPLHGLKNDVYTFVHSSFSVHLFRLLCAKATYVTTDVKRSCFAACFPARLFRFMA